MSKAFTRETDAQDEDGTQEPQALPDSVKNYVTPSGLAALQQELRFLLREERPRVVETVAWAAGNGDRSENGDYIYGKKRLREIDRRVRYLTKRIENAQVVDPASQQGLDRVFFGATVQYRREDGGTRMVTLVGIDEAEAENGKISWLSPVSKALMQSRVGDTIELRAPAGAEIITVLSIRYGG